MVAFWLSRCFSSWYPTLSSRSKYWLHGRTLQLWHLRTKLHWTLRTNSTWKIKVSDLHGLLRARGIASSRSTHAMLSSMPERRGNAMESLLPSFLTSIYARMKTWKRLVNPHKMLRSLFLRFSKMTSEGYTAWTGMRCMRSLTSTVQIHTTTSNSLTSIWFPARCFTTGAVLKMTPSIRTAFMIRNSRSNIWVMLKHAYILPMRYSTLTRTATIPSKKKLSSIHSSCGIQDHLTYQERSRLASWKTWLGTGSLSMMKGRLSSTNMKCLLLRQACGSTTLQRTT